MGIILETRGIVKKFGGLTALFNVDIQIEEKQITGLIGPNGAGKTTIFNVLSGFINPEHGSVIYKKRKLENLNSHKIVGLGVARTWQGLRLFGNLTVLENVFMAFPQKYSHNPIRLFLYSWEKNLSRREQAREILSLVKMQDKADTIVNHLSYAEQKLVAIARLLATEAEVLLFDEPTSGLDEKTVKTLILPLIKGLVERKNKTVCIVEHSIQLVFDICDTVFCLNEGQVLASGAPEVLREDKELNRIFFQMD